MILLVALIYWRLSHENSPNPITQDAGLVMVPTSVINNDLGPHDIPLAYSYPIQTFAIGEGIKFTFRVKNDDSDVTVQYNGGDERGGWDEFIPARNNRPANWSAKNHSKAIDSIAFKLPNNTQYQEVVWVNLTLSRE